MELHYKQMHPNPNIITSQLTKYLISESEKKKIFSLAINKKL
jgi:hypothetical protein